MSNLRISPLTRVEGYGRIDLQLDARGRVQSVRLDLHEATRLFEGVVVGHPYTEVPALVCRICSICSSIHRLAAAEALEQALGVTIPTPARQLRELLQLGGQIESHALHLFALILPDLAGEESLLPLLRARLPLAEAGLALKAFGNRLQKLVGGRTLHPINVEVGGMLSHPGHVRLRSLREETALWAEKIDRLLHPFFDAAAYPAATPAIGVRLALDSQPPALLTGSRLRLSSGEMVPFAHYQALLAEEVVTHSLGKQAHGPAGPFLTGALARHDLQPQPAMLLPAGIHANNAAQALETIWAVQHAGELLDALLAQPEDLPLLSAVVPRAGVGTIAVEAPRGILVHHYVLDSLGRVVSADIVTPTAINQVVMEQQLLADLAPLNEPEAIRTCAERIVRAYDPCISCAVHLFKK